MTIANEGTELLLTVKLPSMFVSPLTSKVYKGFVVPMPTIVVVAVVVVAVDTTVNEELARPT
jgi:hypothetical protein